MSSSIVKTYSQVSQDPQKEMSGLEFVRGLADGTLPLNMMAQTLGYDITEAEQGRVVVTADPKQIHLNPAGTVHGGLAATMLDSSMGLAIHSTLDRGIGSTTLEFKISFLRPITSQTGPIRAEGTMISRGRRVSTAEGRVTDREGRLLVHGTTTCLIFEDLHWIDPTSREALDLTVEKIAGLPVLLVATYRPEFRPPWVKVPPSQRPAIHSAGMRSNHGCAVSS